MNQLFTIENQATHVRIDVQYDPLVPEAGWTLTYVLSATSGTMLLSGAVSGLETDELVRRLVDRLLVLFQWDSRLGTFRGELKALQRAYRAELEQLYEGDPYMREP